MHARKSALFVVTAIAVLSAWYPALATQAVPTNFHLSPGQDMGNGVLRFNETWDSSSGNLQDLSNCKVNELVAYPGSNDPYHWPDPAWVWQTPNPTIDGVNAAGGGTTDEQDPGLFDDYIVKEVSFDASQIYYYVCSLPTTGSTALMGNITITRDVKQVLPDGQPCAKYTVTKLGSSASFIPQEITTCDPQAPKHVSEQVQADHSKNLPIADTQSSNLWKISAHPVSTTVSLGEPIFFDLRITNLSSEPARIDLGGDDKLGLRITTTEPNGLSKPVKLRHGGLRLLGTHLVGAHETYTKRLLLNEWNDFSGVGDYHATVEVVPEFGLSPNDPPTANLHVNIVPRDKSKLANVAKALADRAINGEDVSARGDASFALSYIDDPIAIPEMARVLASGSDAGMPLITALAHLGGPTATAALQTAAKSHPDWSIRIIADRDLRRMRNGKVPLHDTISD